MSTVPVSASSISNGLQSYFQARSSDLQKLGQALQSGDLTAAKQEFSAIQALGQSGPFANGNAFKISQRQQDFTAIGQALQSGDLAGAKQALVQLRNTFHQQPSPGPSQPVVVNLSGVSPASPAPVTSSVAQPAAASTSGNAIVMNLGKVTPGEQITIGISNDANGSEKVTVGLAQPNQSPEQVTLNLKQNSNQQIILNLFNSTADSSAPGSALSVSA